MGIRDADDALLTTGDICLAVCAEGRLDRACRGDASERIDRPVPLGDAAEEDIDDRALP